MPVLVHISQSRQFHLVNGCNSESLCQSVQDIPQATETVSKLPKQIVSMAPRNTFDVYKTLPSFSKLTETCDKGGGSIWYFQSLCDQVEDEAGIQKVAKSVRK